MERFVSSYHADCCFTVVGIVHHHLLNAFFFFWQCANSFFYILLGLAVLTGPVLAFVQCPAKPSGRKQKHFQSIQRTAKTTYEYLLREKNRSPSKKADTRSHTIATSSSKGQAVNEATSATHDILALKPNLYLLYTGTDTR